MSTQTTQPVHPEPQDFPEVPGLDEEVLAPDEISDTGYAAVPTSGAYPEPMPHVEHTYAPEAFVCVRCGSKNLADGYIVDYGEKFEQIHFAPKRITLRWLNSVLALRPWRSLAKLDAIACRDCGAVLLTVKPDELRKAEHRRG